MRSVPYSAETSTFVTAPAVTLTEPYLTLAEKKGCPPVPAPAATSSAEPLPVALAPEVKP